MTESFYGVASGEGVEEDAEGLNSEKIMEDSAWFTPGGSLRGELFIWRTWSKGPQ